MKGYVVRKEELDALRDQLSVESKNGIDFTTAATIVWAVIAYIWTLNMSSYNRSVLVFIAGGPMLPLALLFSKVYKTKWKIENNPLQPLGLWLNFAQLLYFPFLIFILIKQPEYFIMTYAIITGAHFFPYSWLYRTGLYAVFAGLLPVGSVMITLYLQADYHFIVGVWTSVCLLILTRLLVTDYKKKRENSPKM